MKQDLGEKEEELQRLKVSLAFQRGNRKCHFGICTIISMETAVFIEGKKERGWGGMNERPKYSCMLDDSFKIKYMIGSPQPL